ncbi:outer membrane beta-barrel protein [Myroides sp. JBRI-B21084]|uniref:outer membrane beta-barrel protein n=1 Tax=Myroides sp. JBRI-B21084 TaxID=3119977 RepID=UPI0026E3B7AD|nr:outer membrane beta-barrel protein [Paenimyroides cloacae]WKW45857.1 outer membrane beta-barrel protein [Paenimyroides cloacae]
MKKLLCFAIFAFTATVHAQSIDTIIQQNTAIKEAAANDELSLTDKIKVVNAQVDGSKITKEQAYQIITKFTNEQSVEAEGTSYYEPVIEVEEVTVQEGEPTKQYDYDWGKSDSPFDLAMGVQADTVAKYRTKSSIFIAFGVGNVATDGAFANSEFGYMRSNTVEVGIAARTPFNENNNKWGVRYGLSINYNGLATTQNNEFMVMGNQTGTTASAKNLRKGYTYLRNAYITVPFSLDFTTTTKTYNNANRRFKTNEGYNFGLGAYLGYNVDSKQILRYTKADGYKVYEHQKGDWNVTNFQYGVMAYAGTDKFKLVFKYDLNPVFTDNLIDQNYWSLGLQFGL